MSSTDTAFKIGVVTGASKGIGRGVAMALAHHGFDIAVNFHRDQKGAEITADLVRSAGRRALVVPADVGVKYDVDRMFDQILTNLGIPEVLVNNAGIQTWAPLLELKEEDWDRTLRTNL